MMDELKTGHGTLAVIVDDDPAALEMLSLALDEQGFEVMSFNNTCSALYCLPQGEQIDVLILDYSLQSATGLELLLGLRSRYRIRRTVMITGCVEELNPGTARQWRIDQILPKPVDLDQLLLSVGSGHLEIGDDQDDSQNPGPDRDDRGVDGLDRMCDRGEGRPQGGRCQSVEEDDYPQGAEGRAAPRSQ